MPRTQGAKNRPKTNNELLAELKKRGFSVDGTTVKVPKYKPPIEGETPPEMEEIELEIEDEDTSEITTYRCGNCKAELDSQVEKCPYCYAELKWEG